MLPIKAHQLNYQDFGNLVWRDFQKIEDFQKNENIHFDVIISKLRNGVIPGSIVANQLGLPLITIEAPRLVSSDQYELLAPSKIKQLLKDGCNALFVDGICGTGETISKVQEFFGKNFKKSSFHSYCTLVDKKSHIKPDIVGFLGDNFFQPPWEWRSFTPQTHLDRLEKNNIKASEEKNHYVGFGSYRCKKQFDFAASSLIQNEWIEIFNLESYQNKIMSTSGISTLDFPDKFSIDDLNGKYHSLVKEKSDFIQSFGFTHFIEDDISLAILLSEQCPVTNILYVENNRLYKIYGHQVRAHEILNLDFDK